MGWTSGTELMDCLIDNAKKWIPEDQARVFFYKEMIDAFEDRDWDGHDECFGRDPQWDIAVQELHPDWDWPEEYAGIKVVADPGMPEGVMEMRTDRDRIRVKLEDKR